MPLKNHKGEYRWFVSEGANHILKKLKYPVAESVCARKQRTVTFQDAAPEAISDKCERCMAIIAGKAVPIARHPDGRLNKRKIS